MFARFAPALVALAAFACALPAHAVTAFSALRYTTDSALAAGSQLVTQRDVAIDNLAGTTALANVGALPPEATITGYHLVATTSTHWLVFGTTVTLPGGLTVGPRDIASFNGTTYAKLFDGAANGIPDGVSISAIASDNGTQILMVLDSTVPLPGGSVVATPRGVVGFNAGTWSVYLSEATIGAPAEAVIDGLDVLANGHVLFSFDVSGTVGSVSFNDDDILELTPTGPFWELSRSMRATNASFEGADLKDFYTYPTLVPTADDDNDGVPNGVEIIEGLNPFVKDNDVFGNARLFTMQQYRDFLGREGDAAGIQGWVDYLNAGTYNRLQVIDAFLSSSEFAGVVAPVVRLYFATFMRVPDYAGLVFNAGLVRNGTVTLAQLADFFTQSPEFMATYGSLTDSQFVTLLYSNVLGRAPDQAGLDGWISLLQSGYTRGQVLLGFSDSTEYQAAIANEVFVTMMYAGMLHRTPESMGFNGWLGFLDNGTYTRTQVINGFFLSVEYHDRFLP
jgi:Domain of unknown function (DUF4214)